MNKKLLFPLLFLLLSIAMISCSHLSSETQNTTGISSSMNNGNVTTLSQESLTDSSHIRWIGRTNYDSSLQQVNFYHTGTGFTVTFTGTTLVATMIATRTGSASQRPYFTVSLDDEVAPEGQVLFLTQPVSEVTLVSGLEYGVHTVTLLKRSEPIDSETAIASISTDGYFQTPTEASLFKVLILGGSGISGHGDLGTIGQNRTTANSDSMQAFGYLAAKAFDADFQFIAASGWGLKWGYNPTNQSGTVNIRSAFDKIGIDDDENLIDVDYDPNLFVPNVIIVNLGGNDFNAYVLRQTGDALTQAKADFRAAVAEFASYLHQLYPNTMIFWTHTGSQNGAQAQVALDDLDPKHTFSRIVIIKQVGEDGDPEGADGHAGLITHQKNAQILIDAINEYVVIPNH